MTKTLRRIATSAADPIANGLRDAGGDHAAAGHAQPVIVHFDSERRAIQIIAAGDTAEMHAGEIGGRRDGDLVDRDAVLQRHVQGHVGTDGAGGVHNLQLAAGQQMQPRMVEQGEGGRQRSGEANIDVADLVGLLQLADPVEGAGREVEWALLGALHRYANTVRPLDLYHRPAMGQGREGFQPEQRHVIGGKAAGQRRDPDVREIRSRVQAAFHMGIVGVALREVLHHPVACPAAGAGGPIRGKLAEFHRGDAHAERGMHVAGDLGGGGAAGDHGGWRGVMRGRGESQAERVQAQLRLPQNECGGGLLDTQLAAAGGNRAGAGSDIQLRRAGS